MNTTHPDPVDQMGRSLARMLSAEESALPHDISERLRIARQRALVLRKPEPVLRLQTAGADLTLGESQRPGRWRLLGSVLPLLALVAALVTQHVLDQEQFLAELVEIDSALLVDDLPPDAYADPGFIRFLRQPAAAATND